ncbi:MAG: hypothetical protein CBB70_14880 [Planctomycetaceae bacterium TMED10]|nr:MAG: hypothetical protein CBB70_14880 [Planctomycetaceae bacterium TMED10]
MTLFRESDSIVAQEAVRFPISLSDKYLQQSMARGRDFFVTGSPPAATHVPKDTKQYRTCNPWTQAI